MVDDDGTPITDPHALLDELERRVRELPDEDTGTRAELEELVRGFRQVVAAIEAMKVDRN